MRGPLPLTVLLGFVLGCADATRSEGPTQTCEGDRLYDVDASGNRDPTPASTCVCPCVQGGTACPEWTEPVALTPAASCNDVTACLVDEHVHCGESSGQWVHGYRLVNVCEFPIRCYAYYRTVTVTMYVDGSSGDLVRQGYTGPPWLPQFVPGEEFFSGEIYDSEEWCRSTWDAPTTTEVSYHVCVRADDPVNTCLPDVTAPWDELAPVCPVAI